MDAGQKTTRLNEISARSGARAILPPDVERCSTTCAEALNCYLDGCQVARDYAEALDLPKKADRPRRREN